MSYFIGNKIQTAVSHPILNAIFCDAFTKVFEHAKILGGITILLIA